MNFYDLETVVYRVRAGAMLAAQLRSLRIMNGQPHVEVGGAELPLPPAAEPVLATAAKTEFIRIADRLRLAAGKIEALIGKTGTPDMAVVGQVQEVPDRIFNVMQETVRRGQDYLALLAGKVEEPDASGDYIPTDFGDSASQKTADTLATIRVALLWWIDQEQAKLVS